MPARTVGLSETVDEKVLLKKFSKALRTGESKTIEIDIKTFIKNDKYLFGSGMSI